MAKQSNKLHITIIVILILAFFTLLFLSATNKNITTNYNIVDTIEVNKLSDLGVIKIGSATIENNGILSSRVDLKNYIVCQVSNAYGDSFYEIQYRGTRTVQGKAEFFSYDYYQKRIDIGSNEKIELDITVSPYSISKYNVEQNNLYNVTIPFYLYEITDNTDVWNYCNAARTDDAIKIIYVKLNIIPVDTVQATPTSFKY